MHCCRKHELDPKQIFGVHCNSHFMILGMKCLQKQNILQDQPVHGSLYMILLQRLSIFIYQYTSPFERNLGRLTLNSKKMADICLRFTHFINIAYHVIPSSDVTHLKYKDRLLCSMPYNLVCVSVCLVYSIPILHVHVTQRRKCRGTVMYWYNRKNPFITLQC